MADKVNQIKTRISIDGEKEYRSACSAINSTLSTLKKEMELVTASYAGNANSSEALRAKQDVLKRTLDEQNKKVAEAAAILEKAKSSTDVTAQQIQKFERDLLSAQTAVVKTTKNINDIEAELKALGATKIDLAPDVEKAAAKFSELGSVLKGNFKGAMDSSEDGARKLSEAYKGLGGLLKENVAKSFEDTKTSIAGAATKVVSGVGEMSGKIVQFAKDTASGENTVKALGDTLREKLEARIAGAGKEVKGFSEELTRSLNLANSGKEKYEILSREVDATAREYVKATTEFGKNSAEAKELREKLEILAKEQREAGKAADEEEKAVGETKDALKLYSGETENAAKQTEKSGKSFESFGDILKAVGVAIGATAAAAGAAAVKLATEVVQQYGELEQNLGGSEAVFGEYAASIQKTGEEAYKNLGVSQSEYLATANKMGALFQGTGIEQQKSLELTEQAMQRAADMASVMGIDTKTALDSVAGAAKGNFTMMDNLGVSMNAASLEAFALSKGMTTAYKDMSQTEKTELAMQMFFENTKQYAGNFAKESTQTISGSMGLLKSSVSSFVAGLGNANADMTNLTQNIIDAFGSVVQNIVPVLKNIVASLPEASKALVEGIKEMLPTLLEAATSLFSQVLEVLSTLLPELIPFAVDAIVMIAQALIENLPLLVDAAMQIVTSLIQGIADTLPELVPAAIEAITTIVQGLIDNLPLLLDAALQLVMGLADGLLKALPKLIEKLPGIIKGICDFINQAIPQIIEAGLQLFTSLVGALPDIIRSIVAALPEIINSIIKTIVDNIPLIIQAGIDLLTALTSALPEIIAALCEALPVIIQGIADALPLLIPALIDGVLKLIGALLENIGVIIAEIVKAIPVIVTAIWESIVAWVTSLPSIWSSFFKRDKNAEDTAARDAEVMTTATYDAAREAAVKGQELTNAEVNALQLKSFDTQKTAQSKHNYDMASLRNNSANEQLSISATENAMLEKALQDSLNTQLSTQNEHFNNMKSTQLAFDSGIETMLRSSTQDQYQMHQKSTADGVQAYEKMSNDVKYTIANLVKSVSQLLSDILRGFSNLVSKMPEAGVSIIEGLWQGIESRSDWLKSQISAFSNGIKNQFTTEFEIHSPSRWFRDQIGDNLALGLGEGFVDSMRQVSRDMQSAVPSNFDMDATVRGAAAGGYPMSVGGAGDMVIHLFEGGTFINNTPQDSRKLIREVSIGVAGQIRRKAAAME